MPLFAKKGSHYVGALQCGAGRDAYLQFEVSETYIEKIIINKLKPINSSRNDDVDPNQILEQALEAAKQASKEFGRSYFIKSISYIPNDSTHYDLYKRIVWIVLKHKENDGHFKELKGEV